MFERRGEITDPCGLPTSVARKAPSSITPALSHFRISFSIFRSETRFCTASIRSWWSMLSKYFSMSASTTQLKPALAFSRIASNACWAFLPGRNP
jgi:hypothetical protein